MSIFLLRLRIDIAWPHFQIAAHVGTHEVFIIKLLERNENPNQITMCIIDGPNIMIIISLMNVDITRMTACNDQIVLYPGGCYARRRLRTYLLGVDDIIITDLISRSTSRFGVPYLHGTIIRYGDHLSIAKFDYLIDSTVMLVNSIHQLYLDASLFIMFHRQIFIDDQVVLPQVLKTITFTDIDQKEVKLIFGVKCVHQYKNIDFDIFNDRNIRHFNL